MVIRGAVLSKKEILDVIASEIVVCTKCRLHKSRTNAVPGDGDPNGKIMLVGEGPGRSEDVQGKPFVGAAGKFLNSLLDEADLPREGVYICNIVRCRPPNNRDPLPDEIETCTPYLNRQIVAIQPSFIVTLGKHSTDYLFSRAKLSFAGITNVRGRFFEIDLLNLKTTVFPTFHPAAGLYNPEYKKQLIRDFQLFGHELKKGHRRNYR